MRRSVVVKSGDSTARHTSLNLGSITSQETLAKWPSCKSRTVVVPSLWGHCEDGRRRTELSKHGCWFFLVFFLPSLPRPPFSHTSFKLICYHKKQVTFLTKILWGRYKYPYLTNEKTKTDSGFKSLCLSLWSFTATFYLVCPTSWIQGATLLEIVKVVLPFVLTTLQRGCSAQLDK